MVVVIQRSSVQSRDAPFFALLVLSLVLDSLTLLYGDTVKPVIQFFALCPSETPRPTGYDRSKALYMLKLRPVPRRQLFGTVR
jgi:hypothetical protein